MKILRNQNSKLVLTVITFVIILGIAIFIDVKANPPAPNNPFLNRFIQGQTQLADNNIPAGEKTHVVDRMRQDEFSLTLMARPQANYEKNPLFATPLPTSSVTHYAPTGIFQGGPGGAFPFDSIKNPTTTWQGYVQGSLVRVVAGTSPDDSDQMIIIVTIFSPKGGNSYKQTYNIPQKSGIVSIVSEENDRLTLQSALGQEYYFDILSLSFVSSMSIQVTPIFDQIIFVTPVPQSAVPALSTPIPAYP